MGGLQKLIQSHCQASRGSISLSLSLSLSLCARVSFLLSRAASSCLCIGNYYLHRKLHVPVFTCRVLSLFLLLLAVSSPSS